MKKRLVSIILTLAVCVSLFASVLPSASAYSSSDVYKNTNSIGTLFDSAGNLLSGAYNYFTNKSLCFYNVSFNTSWSAKSLISFDVMSELSLSLSTAGYKVSIQWSTANSYWCLVYISNGYYYPLGTNPDSGGMILVAAKADSGQSAATTPYNYYIDNSGDTYNDNSTTDNSSNDTYTYSDTNGIVIENNIDNADNSTTVNNTGDTINGNIIDLTNGTYTDYSGSEIVTYNISDLTYNPVSNNYQVTYYTVNNFNFTYYTYNITYNITNTYVTYIGSTAEYVPDDYVLYYELPDGRNSADLTAEDVEGLSLMFDVVNYDRVATDTHTQALYHFDGNWFDSSYYSDSTSFYWTYGSSITYLDSNAFNGCLYLSSGDHQFVSRISESLTDFTFQGRLYFGEYDSTATVSLYQTGNYCYTSDYNSGSALLFQGVVSSAYGNVGLRFINGKIYASGVWSTTVNGYYTNLYYLGTYEPGQWYDIVFSRCNGSYYVFVNGVRYIVPTMSDYTATLASHLVFKACDHSLTYVDEFRIVDYCVYTAAYQPSTVPFDTNNVYVLPDTTDLKANTIAVQSDIPVNGYRVGGVRPTFPAKGMVYFPIENDKVADCQIYNGSYWESVECRLWTGVRWIPLWAFDVYTLQDLYDVSDSTDTVYITTETGFWSWWVSAWTDFRDWLSDAFEGLGVSVDSDDDTTSDDEGISLWKLLLLLYLRSLLLLLVGLEQWHLLSQVSLFFCCSVSFLWSVSVSACLLVLSICGAKKTRNRPPNGSGGRFVYERVLLWQRVIACLYILVSQGAVKQPSLLGLQSVI